MVFWDGARIFNQLQLSIMLYSVHYFTIIYIYI